MIVTGVQLIAFLAGIVTFAVVLELVRRRQLREKYAALWFVLAMGMGALAVVPGVIDTVADRLGVVDPVNLVFFATILVLLGVAIHLSWEISRMEHETRALAEEVALLRLEVEAQHPDGYVLPGEPLDPFHVPDDPPRTTEGEEP